MNNSTSDILTTHKFKRSSKLELINLKLGFHYFENNKLMRIISLSALMAEISESEPNAYWETKTSSLDKSTFDLVNSVLIECFGGGTKSITISKAEKGQFLYLEQTGKKDWVWKDPILLESQEAEEYYSGNKPIPKNKLLDHLAEISIHESVIPEEGGEVLLYEMCIWCWSNLSELSGTLILCGLRETEIEVLGNYITKKFGFIQST